MVRLDNLEFLCYNCFFIKGLEKVSEKRDISAIQNHSINNKYAKKNYERFFKMDDFYSNHLESLGISESDLKENNNLDLEDRASILVDRI
jgi:hypothetical protein